MSTGNLKYNLKSVKNAVLWLSTIVNCDVANRVLYITVNSLKHTRFR